MNEIIQIDGGLGRCIAFTGVLKKYCELNPNKKIDLISSHPDVFFNISTIGRVYPINTPYLYDVAIKNAKYIKPEPYDMFEYYNEQKHITQCFDKILNSTEEIVNPCISLTETELAIAEQTIKNLRTQNGDKEIILFQPHGQSGGKGIPDESGRSLSDAFALRIFEALKEKYTVIVIKMPEQLGVKGALALQTTEGQPLMFRQVCSLIPYVKACISCDSFLPHACAAMNKKCYVFWGATSPDNLSYAMHYNFLPHQKPYILPNRLPHNMMDTAKLNAELINCYGTIQIEELEKELKK